MSPATKPGEAPARPKKSRKKRRPSKPVGRPLFLVIAAFALGVTSVVLALLLLGPQHRLPTGQLLAPRGDTARAQAAKTAPAPNPNTKNGNGHLNGNGNGPPKGLPFEEHLSPREPQPSDPAGTSEIRNRVEQPPRAGIPGVPGTDVEPVTVSHDAGRGPMMVVVIDDMGDHPVLAKNLTELPFPITMAILPNRPRTRYVANLAAETGHEVILHQPMQPGSYPRVNPGPGAVFTDMDAERVKAQLAENLAQLPNAVGINNHMGSAFTEDAPGMTAVMAVLKAKGLFFLDSVTSATSAAPDAAHKAGVPLYRRAVFLDNVRNPRTILGQLKTAERLALKHGRAIAIGHPYTETLEALKLWAKERDPQIKIVTLTELGPES